jgi:zinc transporter ZupT
MRESIEIIGTLKGVLTIAGGFILFMIIQKTLPESHHHHDTEHCEHGHDRRGAMKVLLGDMLHNIGDGIILVPAFFVSTELGFITAGSIFIHEIVQEISEFIILRQGGYSLGQALLNNFLIALTLFIGIGISILFLHTQTLQAVLLGISAGAFFHIFIHDLLPGHFHLRGKNLWQHIGMGAIGISVIVLIHLLVPHV